MMRPEFMPDLKKEVLEDLIKYLRSLEMKGQGDKEMKGEAMIAEMPPKDSEGEEEALEEPNLDMGEEESEDPGLNDVQMRIKDFFNNKRPKTGTAMKKGRTMFAESREAPKGAPSSGKGSRLMKGR